EAKARRALRVESTSSPSRSIATAPIRTRKRSELRVTPRSYQPGRALPLPAEQHELRAEAGAHGEQHAVAPGLRAPLGDRVAQHEKHRGRGEVAALLQALPGQLELAVRELERRL